jgi:hypothetical protein
MELSNPSQHFFLFLSFFLQYWSLKVYTWSHSTSPVCDGFFFKIGSLELFASGWLPIASSSAF